MNSFFWPTEIKSQTTALVRLGRVLHWLSLVVSAGLVILAFVARGERAPCGEQGPWCDYGGCLPCPHLTFFDEWGGAIFSAAFALGVALVGRAFRYVFAGE